MSARGPELAPAFRSFLIEAKQHGYGGDIKERPDTLEEEHGAMYTSDPYRYIDRWVGGNPYAGHEVVSAKIGETRCTVWGMSYFETKLHGMTGGELQGIMGQVLPQPDPEFPVRGPREWSDGDTKYFVRKVDKTSTLERFDAEEVIAQGGRQLYIARFMGGLVNLDKLEDVKDKFWMTNG